MLGADPEGFFVTRSGQMRSAHRVLPRVGKHNGLISCHGGRISRDGAVFEINPEPDFCRELLYDNCHELLRSLRARANNRKYSLALVPALRLTRKELAALPDDARYFGCEASFNAYTNKPTEIALGDPAAHPYRYAGGHMHISSSRTPLTRERSNHIVRLWDLYLGVPLTFLYDTREAFLRRRYYGQAGDYRPQRYTNGRCGLEYRVPGPELFANSVAFSFSFGVFRACATSRLTPVPRSWWNSVQDAINLGIGIPALLERIDKQGKMSAWYNRETLSKLKAWLKKFPNANRDHGFGDWKYQHGGE